MNDVVPSKWYIYRLANFAFVQVHRELGEMKNQRPPAFEVLVLCLSISRFREFRR